jgi:hypothetical protein
MPCRRLARPAAVVLSALALSALEARGEIKINPQGWRFPNIVTSAKEAIQVGDRTPVIPGKETLNKGYRKADGTFFMTYEIEGKIFGVEVDEDGKPPFEYSIMDADGDGKFETMIRNEPGNTDHAYVPQWIIDYYFSIHPEVKRGPEGKPIAPSINPPDSKASAKGQVPPPKKKAPLPPPTQANP